MKKEKKERVIESEREGAVERKRKRRVVNASGRG